MNSQKLTLMSTTLNFASIYEVEDKIIYAFMNFPATHGWIDRIEIIDFIQPSRQVVFAAIKRLKKENKSIEIATLGIDLLNHNVMDKVGGTATLAYLAGDIFVPIAEKTIEDLFYLLKGNSARRKVISLCQEYADDAANPLNDPFLIIQDAVEGFLQLADILKNTAKGLQPVKDVVVETWDDIEKLNADEDTTCVHTGLCDLDNLTGGFQKGTLTVIAARANAGKSTVAIELAINAAKSGNKVAYFSLEMTNVQVCKKILGRCMAPNRVIPSINISDLFRSKGLRDGQNLKDLSELTKAMEDCSNFDFWLDDESSSNLSYIRTEITKLTQKEGKPDIVFIDYIGLMGANDKFQNRVLELDNTLKGLRAIAKDFDIAIVGLAQINRGVEARQDKRPGLADIRESGGYEQEAALVLGLYNPKLYDAKAENILEILVLKNRFGARGSVTVGFEPQYNRMYNLA
jgi:replicative DNA helicase